MILVRLEPPGCGGRAWPAASPSIQIHVAALGEQPLWQGWLPPEFAHKRMKVLLSGRHWVGLLMTNFLKVWIFFPPFARSVRACPRFHTVCSLYVRTDGFNLIFYLVLQQIKLKLQDMLPLQFKREKKIK